jgi:AcrR family transcriptional regulator
LSFIDITSIFVNTSFQEAHMDVREKILEAAVQVFMRFGVGRTRMGDIAEQAGLVRQTLYTVFKNKDEILRASILLFAERSLTEMRGGWQKTDDLSAQLEIYYRTAIRPSFQMINASAEARDMVGGYNAVGQTAVSEAQAHKIAAWSEVLTAQGAGEPDELARYIVLGALGLRDLAASEAELDTLLALHTRAVVALVTQ